MRYLIILNEDSGKAGKTAPGAAPDELRAAFAEAGIEADVHLAGPGRIEAALQAAVASRPDAVIIGGGDGTVRSAAAALADTGIPLGVLPLGTFNHFAKDLKMPLDVKEGVAALAGGAVRSVDLGEVNGHVFINNCSIGAYAEAVRRRDALRHYHGLAKWWAMWRASFEEFRRLRRLRLRIATFADNGLLTTDHGLRAASHGSASAKATADKPRTTDHKSRSSVVSRQLSDTGRAVRTPVVVIGNNRYSGHLFSHHLRPRLDEGQLWLYTVHARRHLAVVRMMLQSLVGRLDEADALDAEPATEIVIESDCGPLPVAADGEVLKLTAPLRFRIRPGALRVLLPRAEGAGQEAKGDGREENCRSLLAGDSAHSSPLATKIACKQAPTAESSIRFLRWPEAQR